MIQMEQVHGNRVVIVGKKDDGKIIKNCDALITTDADVELCVRVADCLPIFVTDEKGQIIGLIHAGWRGLSKGIIKSTINKMENQWKMENGLHPEGRKLKIWIGPHICKKHYEVKNDVSSKFLKYPKALTLKGSSFQGSRTFLDLGEIARQQLVELGVKNKNITIDGTCTYESKDLYSFRRDGTKDRNLFLLSQK